MIGPMAVVRCHTLQKARDKCVHERHGTRAIGATRAYKSSRCACLFSNFTTVLAHLARYCFLRSNCCGLASAWSNLRL